MCYKCLRAERFFYNFPFLIFILFYDILVLFFFFFLLPYFTSQSLPTAVPSSSCHYYYHCYCTVVPIFHRLYMNCRNAGFITQMEISCKHNKFRANVRVVTGNPFSVDLPGWFAMSVCHDRTRTYTERQSCAQDGRLTLDGLLSINFVQYVDSTDLINKVYIVSRFYHAISRDPNGQCVFSLFVNFRLMVVIKLTKNLYLSIIRDAIYMCTVSDL